jgi:hypothetical protein
MGRILNNITSHPPTATSSDWCQPTRREWPEPLFHQYWFSRQPQAQDICTPRAHP